MTGIEYDLDMDEMTVHGQKVQLLSISIALEAFINFISNRPTNPILVGHNIVRFDNPILRNAAANCGQLELLENSVNLCIDTLQAFRSKYPGLKSYKQQRLVSMFIGVHYKAHDAIQDTIHLKMLFEQKFRLDEMMEYATRF